MSQIYTACCRPPRAPLSSVGLRCVLLHTFLRKERSTVLEAWLEGMPTRV